MKILKFGGSVLQGVQGFAKIVPIVKSVKEETIVVISAFSTATQQLVTASTLASKGELEKANQLIDALVDSFHLTIEELIETPSKQQNIHSMIELGKKEVSDFLEGLSITRELTERTLDAVMSFGEFFSLHIVSHYLRENGITVESIDARQFLITNDEYGNAMPIRSETKDRLHQIVLPALQRSSIVITQGFVGRTLSGETTTLGKESSTTTATLLASLLHANEVIIYTNVEGIRTADPRRITNSKVIPHLSYNQASILANEGVKLLHSSTIEPLFGTSIPLTICSLFSPDKEATIIQSSKDVSIDETTTSYVIIEHPQIIKVTHRETITDVESKFIGFHIAHKEQHNDYTTYYLLKKSSADKGNLLYDVVETLSGISIVTTNKFDSSTIRKIIKLLSQTSLNLFSIQPNLVFAVFNNITNQDVVQAIHDSIV
jgi:aspartate kinase